MFIAEWAVDSPDPHHVVFELPVNSKVHQFVSVLASGETLPMTRRRRRAPSENAISGSAVVNSGTMAEPPEILPRSGGVLLSTPGVSDQHMQDLHARELVSHHHYREKSVEEEVLRRCFKRSAYRNFTGVCD